MAMEIQDMALQDRDMDMEHLVMALQARDMAMEPQDMDMDMGKDSDLLSLHENLQKWTTL